MNYIVVNYVERSSGLKIVLYKAQEVKKVNAIKIIIRLRLAMPPDRYLSVCR